MKVGNSANPWRKTAPGVFCDNAQFNGSPFKLDGFLFVADFFTEAQTNLFPNQIRMLIV